jgi:hypothetical protein
VTAAATLDSFKLTVTSVNAYTTYVDCFCLGVQVRDWIVPVNRRAKLPALMGLLRRHYASGNGAGRRVLLEYTMLAGVNDSLEDAQRLLQLLEGVEAKVRPGQGPRARHQGPRVQHVTKVQRPRCNDEQAKPVR